MLLGGSETDSAHGHGNLRGVAKRAGCSGYGNGP